MDLTLGGRIIAETQIQGVSLHALLGSYELNFGLLLKVHADEKASCRIVITGAQISAKFNGSTSHKIGFARAHSPFEIRTKKVPSGMSPELILPLQPGQLAAIEHKRHKSDIEFELFVVGNGTEQSVEHAVQANWSIRVARSEWIENLRKAGARDILLLEVPLPLLDVPKKWADITDGLRRAEECYRNGDYLNCVASCRTVIQELGHHKFEKKDWAGPKMDPLASNRVGMTKDERKAALWGVLRHYTHQAHHGAGERGETSYSRADAQMVLTLAATFVAHAQAE